ncbi:MAG: magnesium transporter CorA family protein [Acidimicrobiales bacterium]
MSHRILVRGPDESRLRPRHHEELDDQLTTGAFVWLDIDRRDAEELDELGERFGFDPAAIEDVLDVEQLPKFDNYGDHLFVVLHALTTDEDRLDTHEVDCFLKSNLLVTVRTEQIAGLEWLWNAVQAHPHMAEHGSDELFAQLAEVIGRRYIEVINAVESRVDALADAALSAEPNVLAEVQVLRREEATVRRVLRPQRLVIAALRSNTGGFFTGESIKLLTDAYDVHNLVVESLESTRGLLTDTLDTYRGASAERQAHAATMLTVYAAILLPLTLITGWYGMNVSNLPGSESRWGWSVVTGLMMLFAVVSWLIFVKVGMVRRPRLTAPSRLTSGLADVARAPVKPFTMLRRSQRPRSQRPSPQRPASQQPGPGSDVESGDDGNRGSQRD